MSAGVLDLDLVSHSVDAFLSQFVAESSRRSVQTRINTRQWRLCRRLGILSRACHCCIPVLGAARLNRAAERMRSTICADSRACPLNLYDAPGEYLYEML